MKNQNHKGFILIFTLGFLVALSVAVVEFSAVCRTRTDRLTTSFAAVQSSYLAEIGIEAGKKILLADTNNLDWPGEAWASGHDFLLGENRITVTIVDENRKLNLNGILQKGGKLDTGLLAIAQRLFVLLDRPGNLADPLLDWMDEDELPRPGGAESDVYASFTPPYRTPGKPLSSLAELFLISGYDEKLLGGDPEKDLPGLTDLVTIYSDSKININTCDRVLLRAIGFPDADVERILNERETKSLNETILLSLSRTIYIQNRSHITFTSATFTITAVGETASGVTRTMRAVVTKGKEMKVLAVDYP